MSGKIGSYIVRGIWIQAGITDIDKVANESGTGELRCWQYLSTAQAQLVVPMSKKGKYARLGLPDIKKSYRDQRIKAVGVKQYMEAVKNPALSYKAQWWRLLRSIHNAISNPTPLEEDMEGIAQIIAEKLEETIKIDNWDRRIVPRLESVQCD